MPDYSSFTTQDFVLDPSFKQWVLAPTDETNRFWQAWRAAHPSQRASVDQARAVILKMPFYHYDLEADEQAYLWKRIQEQTEPPAPAPSVRGRPAVTLPARRWQPVVAAAVFLLIAWGGWWATQTPWNAVRYATDYGETKTVTLPDGSRVILNAHSRLRFSDDWDEPLTREVWLEGEALFKVSKVPHSYDTSQWVKFVVHTGRLDVSVVGTVFNVKDRDEATEVVLDEGQVVLTHQRAQLPMIPGERVTVTDQTTVLRAEKTHPTRHTAWQRQEFIFDNTSLREVGTLLEDHYGWTVRLAPGLSQRRFSSTIPFSTQNIDHFLAMIEKLYQVSVVRQEEAIVITHQP